MTPLFTLLLSCAARTPPSDAPPREEAQPLNTGQCIAAVRALTDSSTVFADYDRWYFSRDAWALFSTQDCLEAFPKAELSGAKTNTDQAATLCEQLNTERGLFVTTASVQTDATQIRIGAALVVPYYRDGESENTWAVMHSAQVMLVDVELSMQPDTLVVRSRETRWLHSSLKPKCEGPVDLAL